MGKKLGKKQHINRMEKSFKFVMLSMALSVVKLKESCRKDDIMKQYHFAKKTIRKDCFIN
ncbi:hypothetical protein BIY37_09610 [Candidatus Brocadia sapporoensis]|uniref:Uncharacterized protein n=1 Tax=Candidatus Brocadia sapporoensis TaxID=392547 RepID=A0A1V6LYD9_9BACT|nr:hypothetical protein BIY37_09610 [Candidatus Brocadia sapporoensis]OQZ04028.1 MAG: hypothetical protein B6D34_05360 [Candidatus Brocadia sp. UTAMX1]TVL96351.1 MAG: hypothetical protein CV082_06880 [Candidatus Brocadia sp. BL1]GJQ24060.1 MAG: hypothetical protein HBSAPP01_18500 [Candidatus Brocadia sapporoensis]